MLDGWPFFACVLDNRPLHSSSHRHDGGCQEKRELTPYIVTTEFRGVFFGYADDVSGDTITLTNARNAIYWSSKTGGFMGLASEGPGNGSRIGARADIVLRKVTAVLPVTDAAAAAWEAAKVYRG